MCIGGSHVEGTVWPNSHYEIQHDVEWLADDTLVDPTTRPPKEAEWKLRITMVCPHHDPMVTGQLDMYLKFALEWLPPTLDHLLEPSAFHPQSRALAI